VLSPGGETVTTVAPAAVGYWIEAAGRGALRPTTLREPGGDDLVLQALCTGVSPGTERLVGLGRVPASLDAAMAVPGMQGSFALPLLYGYSFVGRVAAGERAGERVFTMHPHTTHAVVAAASCVPLPAGVPAARATLFANLETAVNAVWDAELVELDRVVVIGGGAIGLLCAFAVTTLSAARVTLVEADASRRALAARLPWLGAVVAPDDAERAAFSCALHTSGSEAGLQLAIDVLGFEGRVLDLAWYGERAVSLRLGTTFHHQRKTLRASQVGTVARAQRAAGRGPRTAAVLRLLADPRLDALLGAAVAWPAVPALFAAIYRGEPTPVCPVVGYE
jgi:2-desacetyl-2-hydroxyethyl bacteriochlorophyllide A dehydrogenase